MTSNLDETLRAWTGLGVLCRHDPATQSWIFIALHDDTLGSPVGGTRMKAYARPEDGLRDAMRLAEGMTHKWAAIDFDHGGGKAVIALSRPVEGEERTELLELYARLLNTLRGGFSTGQDLGTTTDDMLTLSRKSKWVHGFDAEAGTMIDPGPYTALGVFAGLQAVAEQLRGRGGLEDCAILIQGAGGVGAPLAELCARAGARVAICDADVDRANAVARKLGAALVSPDAAYTTECDIYAPCAVGATLNRETIPLLRCRAVAGSANNQLDTAEDAARLHERGILYAPDYVINAGGALAFGLRGRGELRDEVLRDRVSGLGKSLREIFVEAGERGESPFDAARRRVERALGGRPD